MTEPPQTSQGCPEVLFCFVLKPLHGDQTLEEKCKMKCSPSCVIKNLDDVLVLTQHQMALFHCVIYMLCFLNLFTFNLDKENKKFIVGFRVFHGLLNG